MEGFERIKKSWEGGGGKGVVWEVEEEGRSWRGGGRGGGRVREGRNEQLRRGGGGGGSLLKRWSQTCKLNSTDLHHFMVAHCGEVNQETRGSTNQPTNQYKYHPIKQPTNHLTN